MTQVAYSFDKASLIKIGKGALIAGTGTAALYILNAIGTIDIGMFTPLIAGLVPFFVNLVKEWMKGK